MKCLGIDIGSSSIKGAILDLEDCAVGEVIKEDFPAPISDLPVGYFEVEPSQIQAAVENLLVKLFEDSSGCRQAFTGRGKWGESFWSTGQATH